MLPSLIPTSTAINTLMNTLSDFSAMRTCKTLLFLATIEASAVNYDKSTAPRDLISHITNYWIFPDYSKTLLFYGIFNI